MSRHCQQNKCQKPCEKKEPCHKEKKCCVYNEWSESDSSCEQPKGYKRTYTVTEYVFKQRKSCGKKWGRTVKCTGSWSSVSACEGKFQKKHCKK